MRLLDPTVGVKGCTYGRAISDSVGIGFSGVSVDIRLSYSSVIAGATKPEQIRANVRASGWSLTDGDMAEVAVLTSQKVS